MLTLLSGLTWRRSRRAPVPTPAVQTAAPTALAPPEAVKPLEALILRHSRREPVPRHPEVLEAMLEQDPGNAALQDQLEVARLDTRYPRVDLKALLAETRQCEGTGKLPIVALFPIGNRQTARRDCIIQSQGASRGGVRSFSGSPALMVSKADLSQAVSGKENHLRKPDHLEVRWQAAIVGTLPDHVTDELSAGGLLEAGETGRRELPHGTTTAVLVAEAPWGAETFDPAVFLVRRKDSSPNPHDVICWYHCRLGCFDMQPVPAAANG